jgi:hypothetical protein
MKWLKNAFALTAYLKPIKRIFLVKDGGKDVINKKSVLTTMIMTTILGVGFGFYLSGGQDDSLLEKSTKPINVGPARPQGAGKASGNVDKMLQNSEAKGNGERSQVPHGHGMKINYKAKQVVLNDGAFDPDRTMPMGTNIIGRTMTTIDTRQAAQLVKVLLPYGGSAKAGGQLPKNSVLFGQVTYGGKGEKVFIKFDKGVLPSGEELQVEAQGLSPSDYSPGLLGQFHGNRDMRVATAMGLTMVAAASNVLTEREAIGGSALMPGAVNPKATMKNAMYQGASQVAQSEANRQAQEIGEAEEYVTVDAGTDLIVSLTKAFKND